MSGVIDQLALLIQRGGYIMVPLLALSIVSLTLIIERAGFWMRVHGRASLARLAALHESLRSGDDRRSRSLLADDRTPYGAVARRLIEVEPSDAVALQAVETERPRFDRFMVTLSTIITAAPLLGILGTVIGIIQSFNLLGQQSTMEDPSVVSVGIAEALLTTALGLVVALFTLFPYMAFKGQANRALGHLESVVAAAQEGQRRSGRADAPRPARPVEVG